MGFSLLVCMSVLARNFLSPRPFSLCSYVCIGLPKPAHPPKVKYSLSVGMNKGKANGVQAIRQNISLWEGVLVPQGQYRHTSREKKALETEYFWPIQTYIRAKRERNRWISCLFNCGEDRVGSSLPKLWLVMIMKMFGYVTGFLQLFRGNQID